MAKQTKSAAKADTNTTQEAPTTPAATEMAQETPAVPAATSLAESVGEAEQESQTKKLASKPAPELNPKTETDSRAERIKKNAQIELAAMAATSAERAKIYTETSEDNESDDEGDTDNQE
ncbi:hypothetical protein [Siphonobacter sp.]|uniref:hypothetical protein n=1 Tax=Siphonobacter sp. TaxID=1869184 RepID=UPI003B3B2032